ncbi:MAG: hypothetical protein FJ276_21965 [Planctomycetes bacterium]|nr:hypothetical protein [Planctomycetota bacterium]
MSVGPMGSIGGAAGSPLAQSQGTDVQRAQQETADQTRQAQLNAKAEQAAGIGQTEEDAEASDRDADGRRPWETASSTGSGGEAEETADGTPAARSKDPTGQKGNRLDLTG